MKVKDLIIKLLELDISATIGISHYVDQLDDNNNDLCGEERIDIYTKEQAHITEGHANLDYYLR